MYINKKNGYSCEQPFLCYKNKNLTNSGVRISEAWSKCGDSNSRPPVPETGALPTALHLERIIYFIFATVRCPWKVVNRDTKMLII